MTEIEKPKENRFQGVVRPLAEKDMPQIEAILDPWIRFPVVKGALLTDELQETLEEIRKSLNGENDKNYFVAQNPDGSVVGMMGYQPLRPEMAPLAKTDKPIEVINAYVSRENRVGRGVGKALLSTIENQIQEKGFTEILLNSGPRYRETGWPFWKKMLGEPAGTLQDFYGKGFHAMVWRKVF